MILLGYGEWYIANRRVPAHQMGNFRDVPCYKINSLSGFREFFVLVSAFAIVFESSSELLTGMALHLLFRNL